MPRISVKLVVLIISLALLQSGCGIMDIIDLFDELGSTATFETASYEHSSDDQCYSETYDDAECDDSINPFPEIFIIAITDATTNEEYDRYTLHNNSLFRITQENGVQLYETDILKDMNSNMDFGFITEKDGYTCSSTIYESYGEKAPEVDDDSYEIGAYVTTECVNSQDTSDTCHLCYGLLERIGRKIDSDLIH